MFTFDTQKLDYEIQTGYVSRRPHPTNDNLFILNYTHKCTFEWRWNKTTIHCRGTIVDKNNNVLWKPFAKFFTFDQYEKLRNSVYELYGLKYKGLFTGSYRIEEKIDGSLGVLYHDGKKWAVASRGSFDSEQAIKATEIWQRKYSNIEPDPSLTYVVEIVYPENRIIVDYKETEDLFLLDVLETHTGKSIIDKSGNSNKLNLWYTLPSPYTCYKTKEELDNLSFGNADEEEGFVIKYNNGVYVKVKSKEYQEVAKILSHVTKDYIFEHLINCSSVLEIKKLANILPRTLLDDISNKFSFYNDKYNEVFEQIKDIVELNIWLNDRDFGLKFHNHPLKGPIFAYRKKTECDKEIWKYVKNNNNDFDQNTKQMCQAEPQID